VATAAIETRRSDVPAEVDRWNWGAFLLNTIWALGHRLWWQALLSIVPVFGIIMTLVLALKGGRWAWEKGTYASVEEYKAKERRWTIAGLTLYGLVAALIVLGAIAG
jgi:hypothetical protein